MVKVEVKRTRVTFQLFLLLIRTLVLGTEQNARLRCVRAVPPSDSWLARDIPGETMTWTPHPGSLVKVLQEDRIARYDGGQDTWLLLGAATCPYFAATFDRNLIIDSDDVRSTYDAGTVLKLRCRDNYELSHSLQLTCLDNGMWNTAPPTCSVIQTPVSLTYVAEKESRVLNCVDSELDQYLDRWLWMKDQRILKPDGDLQLNNIVPVIFTASLNVTQMHKSMEGIYTCVSTDFGGVTRHRSISLLSGQREQFAFDVFPQNVIIAKGKFAVLFCSAQNAEIDWSKDGKTLRTQGQHYTILPNNALLIYDADISINGNYTCSAEHMVTKARIWWSAIVRVDLEVDETCGHVRVRQSFTSERHQPKRKGKIFRGREADRGSHPWMALITIKKVNGERAFCGGSLINRHWVITAAHCLDNVTDGLSGSWIRVILGKHTRQEKTDNEQVYDVAESVIHAFYNGTSFDNDLALLRLSRKIQFTDHIVPICLPPPRFMDNFYPAVMKRINGTVAGWGRLSDRGILSEYLREVSLPIVDTYECDRSAGEVVGRDVFCAGVASGVVDSCEGDSGGAFEIVYEGRTYVAGIVSWGIDCGRPGMYGFYTRVDRYVNYIKAYAFQTDKWSENDVAGIN